MRLLGLLVALLALVLPRAQASPHVSQPVSPTVSPKVSPKVSKVLLVVLENHGTAAAMRGLPWLTGQAATYGRATAWSAQTHPSLPNYLALAGGTTAGIRDDAGPAVHRVDGASIMDEALAAGRTATAYVDGMPSPCAPGPAGLYAVKHNPWAYYAAPASRVQCRAHDLPLGSLGSGALRRDVDAGTLPTVGMLVPDLCHDAHDCPLGTADAFLRSWLGMVERGPDFRSGRLAVVVTFDEDEGTAADGVFTAVLARSLHHVVVHAPLTHYSWTRWAAELAGVRPPAGAAGARSMGTAFGLR